MHRLVKHSVRIAGHATSVSLESGISGRRCARSPRGGGLSVNALLSAIDAERGGNLSSAIRLFVLESCRRGELAAVAIDQRRRRRADEAAGLRANQAGTI